MSEIPKPNIVTVLEFLGGRCTTPDRGGWRKATCPIHDDKTPSASVNEDDCRFRCFTCDFSGDAVDLIMEAQSVGWADALRIATELAGEGDGHVRAERGGSSLLPRPSGNRAGRRAWSAPWKSL